MNVTFIGVRPNGKIVKSGSCSKSDLIFQSAPGATIIPVSWSDEPPRAGSVYWTGAALAARPVVLTLPDAVDLDTGETWAPAGVGSDVEIRVDGVSAGLWDGSIEFAAAGEYAVRFDPPFPAQVQLVKVSVG